MMHQRPQADCIARKPGSGVDTPGSLLRRLPLVAVAVVAGLVGCRTAAAQEESSADAYRVQVKVIVEAPHGRREYLKRRIAEQIPSRLQVALGGRCNVRIEFTGHFPLLEVSAGTGIQPQTPAAVAAADLDKVLHLHIRQTHRAFEILAQDYDVATRYLCPPVEREARQPGHVVERSCETLLTALAPTAEFRQLPEDPDQVIVTERLRPRAADEEFAVGLREGDVLIPVLRRRSLEGESALPETMVVPWTVLVVEDRTEDGVRCRIESGSRRPFGVRRRGRIDQLAVAIRPAPRPVTLRLTTQSEPQRPLPGCHVYLRGAGESADSPVLVGVSDHAGRIVIPPSQKAVQTVLIKSGELLIGKLPVVGGLYESLDVPLAEDPARIRAAADLAALRTELIDLVARRNILLARGRAAVQAADLDLARRITDELDRLPTRSQFNQRIDSVAQAARSQNRLAQERIDRLVDETRSVLAKYLDSREIGDLRNAIIEAG